MAWGEYRDTVQVCSDGVRYAKAYLELKLVRDVKGSKKGFYRHISNLRKTRGSVGLLNGTHSIWQQPA